MSSSSHRIFREQREWRLERPPSIFFGTLGASTFIVSKFADVAAGLLLGWTLAVVARTLVLYYYIPNKRNLRFIVSRIRSSWISRGVVGILIFTLSALPYSLVKVVGLEVHQAVEEALGYTAVAAAMFLLMYEGVVQATSRAITIWASGSIPVLFATTSIPASILLVNSIAQDPALVLNSRQFFNIFILLSAYTLGTHLWVSKNVDVAGRESVVRMVLGDGRLPFLLGIALLYVVPAAIFNLPSTPHNAPLIHAAAASMLAGMYIVIYLIVRYGIYRPVFYTTTHHAPGPRLR